jgi:hypothetical protein
MAFEKVQDGKTDPTGNGRVWAGQVTLSSGTYTLDYSADLPGVSGDLPAEPVIVATSKGDDSVFVSSAGTSQATLSDGSTSSSNTVNVVIHEQGGQ